MIMNDVFSVHFENYAICGDAWQHSGFHEYDKMGLIQAINKTKKPGTYILNNDTGEKIDPNTIKFLLFNN